MADNTTSPEETQRRIHAIFFAHREATEAAQHVQAAFASYRKALHAAYESDVSTGAAVPFETVRRWQWTYYKLAELLSTAELDANPEA